jgi:hypothetical protein
MNPHDTDEPTSWEQVHEVIDAVYRFGAGQDLRDEELFLSAFAPDATLDFVEPAERFGATIPVMTNRVAIRGILTTLEPLVTTHTVTNPRVTFEGDEARLWCLVEAQHVDRSEPSRHLLLKNHYDVRLVRDGRRYVIVSMVIHNAWFDGDPSVLFGPVTPSRAAS